MKTYNVTIRAIITKTYEIDADDAGAAEEVGHEIFSVQNEEDVEERYDQETILVNEKNGVM